MMQGGMPGSGVGMSGALGPGGNVEQLIAGYKNALAITDAQLPQWNAFADTLRAGAKLIEQARRAASSASTAPAQLERRGALLEAEAAAIRQSQAGAAALYDVLSAQQQRAADVLMADHLARM